MYFIITLTYNDLGLHHFIGFNFLNHILQWFYHFWIQMSRPKETRENKSYLMKRKNISWTIRFWPRVEYWNWYVGNPILCFWFGGRIFLLEGRFNIKGKVILYKQSRITPFHQFSTTPSLIRIVSHYRIFLTLQKNRHHCWAIKHLIPCLHNSNGQRVLEPQPIRSFLLHEKRYKIKIIRLIEVWPRAWVNSKCFIST